MNKIYFNILIIAFLQFFFIGDSIAYHIIGGEMSYKCIGNDDYEVTIVMYRDCATLRGADFDSNRGEPVATVTVWQDGRNEPYLQTIELNAPKVSRISHGDYNPCMIIPPRTCVERGVYTFVVKLPRSNASYHVVYQRCCRSATVLNLQFPAETGATFQVEVTPEAQRRCYTSPSFKEIPPMVTCAGYPIEIDQSVKNPNPSMTIEYSLCAPYAGGGPMGSQYGENPYGYDGVTPNPDSRPPFDEVDYVSGYDALNPINGSPQLSIDPQTGIITGTPDVYGQYAIGICVTQRNNGVIVSQLRRDFQLNVVECKPMIKAIAGGPMLDRENRVLLCGGRTVEIENLSTDEEYIVDYRWEFMEKGSHKVLTDKNFKHTFADTGIYQVMMFLNKDLSSCNDSLSIEVEIRNDIEAKFEIYGDSCEAESVYIVNNSHTMNGAINEYAWELETGNFKSEKTPTIDFQFPGNKKVMLAVKDQYSCVDTMVINYPYFPRPSVVDVRLLQELHCTRSGLQVENNSFPLDSSYQVNWYISNGDFYTGLEPEFVFDEAGEFDLSLEIISPIGCTRTEEYPVFFDVYITPYAAFDYNPKELSQYEKSVDFINLSESADFYSWIFDEDGSSTSKNPFFTFPDTGYKHVSLYAGAFNGCRDSITKLLDIAPLTTYYLPSAFTPDDDGINDGYRGEGYFPYIENFKMEIYSRWGERLFVTEDPRAEWNGRHYNTGKRMPQGAYVVVVEFTDPRGIVYKKKTFATLLD